MEGQLLPQQHKQGAFMRAALFTIALSMFSAPVAAQERQAIFTRALQDAISQFEAARPRLPSSVSGVDIEAYRHALALRPFAAGLWQREMLVEPIIRAEATASCARYAAFVRLPPEKGRVRLVLCPQFFEPGGAALRAMTLLHEMVHAVAGADECRAMAFTALVQKEASGRFTPVDTYWRANGCEGSEFRLP